MVLNGDKFCRCNTANYEDLIDDVIRPVAGWTRNTDWQNKTVFNQR